MIELETMRYIFSSVISITVTIAAKHFLDRSLKILQAISETNNTYPLCRTHTHIIISLFHRPLPTSHVLISLSLRLFSRRPERRIPHPGPPAPRRTGHGAIVTHQLTPFRRPSAVGVCFYSLSRHRYGYCNLINWR